MRLLPFVAAAAVLSASFAAHADTLQNFNLSGAFDNGTGVSGTFTVDITSGVLEGGSLSYLGGTYNVLSQSTSDPAQDAYVFGLSETTGTYPELLIGLNGPTSLAGYSGGLLCSEANTCNGGLSAYETASGSFTTYLVSGAATPGSIVTAATPEPSSIALLGTGMLGVAGVIRKRLA